MAMDMTQTLFKLSSAYGVSGEEDNAANTALDMLKAYTSDCFIKNGNVIGNFGERKEGVPHLLLDAHIDQVGLIVTGINDSGFLSISNVGGIDRRLLPAQRVKVHGRQVIDGVVCSIPPHLSKNEDKVGDIDEFFIDIGLDKAEGEKIVSPGDRISFATMPQKLLGTRVSGCAYDDRSGVAAILYALELLKNDAPGCSFTVLFSTQEELGERGACIGAFDIDPDIALAIDVSFGRVQGDKESESGELGKGPMIGISPSLSREVSSKLIELSEKEDIPWQPEVMSGLTSTNADRFSVNKKGCKACTVSIPLKYMHTPAEIIDIRDVEQTGRLIAQYVRSV